MPYLGVAVIAAFNAFYWLPIRAESPRADSWTQYPTRAATRSIRARLVFRRSRDGFAEPEGDLEPGDSAGPASANTVTVRDGKRCAEPLALARSCPLYVRDQPTRRTRDRDLRQARHRIERIAGVCLAESPRR
jgi:hypothetical protein